VEPILPAPITKTDDDRSFLWRLTPKPSWSTRHEYRSICFAESSCEPPFVDLASIPSFESLLVSLLFWNWDSWAFSVWISACCVLMVASSCLFSFWSFSTLSYNVSSILSLSNDISLLPLMLGLHRACLFARERRCTKWDEWCMMMMRWSMMGLEIFN
jgi:hypothetical protein